MESAWQFVIPDSLLLEIFCSLELDDLGRVARVCKLWCRVSGDDSLWNKLARKLWKIKGPLLPQQTSWKEEVKRLYYHVPLIEMNCIDKHSDEVLDVAISHNGKYFCTVSKDSSVIMWDLDNPTHCISEVDTSKDLEWMLTQYSLFNEDDSLILVCGVRKLTAEQEANEPNGCAAVFTVPGLSVVSLIYLEPFTLFGAWLDNRIFIAGLSCTSQDFMHMRAYRCQDEFLLPTTATQFSNHPDKLLAHYAQHQTGLFSYRGSRLHQMNVITAKVPIRYADGTVSKRRSTEIPSNSNEFHGTYENEFEIDKGATDKLITFMDDTSQEYTQGIYDNNVTKQGNCVTSISQSGYRTYVMLVAGEHDVILLFEVTDEHIEDIQRQFDEQNYDSDTAVVNPDHQFHIKDCYITGLCLSPDNRFAYFNHREVSHKPIDSEDEYERTFSSQLRIGIIDLVSMVRVKDIEYKGHIGYSDYSPWYICLDISSDFIISGSEDGRAYIWEKNYNTCLGTLKHKEGVVNGVAFSPVDQETCVTVCDDKLIKVWRSRHRKKQIRMKELTDYSYRLLMQFNQMH